ncbi:MAG: hypothetical protein GY811_19070 [Myxococcales bacterium]|nr:hypothetical protein [Myxococcales bacterium]
MALHLLDAQRRRAIGKGFTNDLSHFIDYSGIGLQILEDGLEQMSFGEYLESKQSRDKTCLADCSCKTRIQE